MLIYSQGVLIDDVEDIHLADVMKDSDILIKLEHGNILWDKNGNSIELDGKFSSYVINTCLTASMFYDSICFGLMTYGRKEYIVDTPHVEYIIGSLENMLTLIAILISKWSNTVVYLNNSILKGD